MSFVQLQVLMTIAPALMGWMLMLPASQPLIAHVAAAASHVSVSQTTLRPPNRAYRIAAARVSRPASCLVAQSRPQLCSTPVPPAAERAVSLATDYIRSSQTCRAP